MRLSHYAARRIDLAETLRGARRAVILLDDLSSILLEGNRIRTASKHTYHIDTLEDAEKAQALFVERLNQIPFGTGFDLVIIKED